MAFDRLGEHSLSRGVARSLATKASSNTSFGRLPVLRNLLALHVSRVTVTAKRYLGLVAAILFGPLRSDHGVKPVPTVTCEGRCSAWIGNVLPMTRSGWLLSSGFHRGTRDTLGYIWSCRSKKAHAFSGQGEWGVEAPTPQSGSGGVRLDRCRPQVRQWRTC